MRAGLNMTRGQRERWSTSIQSRVLAHDRDFHFRPLILQLQQGMSLSQLAVPSVYGLIFFLGYPSQWMLMYLEPAPLTKNELIVSNVILVLIFITYTKSVFVDPGTIPKDWAEKELGNLKGDVSEKEGDAVAKNRKWCRKCDAAKPPRAHHCKECKRYGFSLK
jgi:palmitoyltransferase